MIHKRLNKKRLTKKETDNLILDASLYDQELSELVSWEENYVIKLYHLSENRILYVYSGMGMEGKSDIYSKDVFLELLAAIKLSKRNFKLGISDSLSWFMHFSKFKGSLPIKINEALKDFREYLTLSSNDLDFSLQSLSLLAGRIRNLNTDNPEEDLIDGLVAYCGEIINNTINGEWISQNEYSMPSIYKDISHFPNLNWYHPVNVVWEAFRDPANLPFRKNVSLEIGKYKTNLAKMKRWTR